MPLTNDATYEEVLAKLQELTGINQRSELAVALASIGVVTSPSDSVAQLVAKTKQISNIKSIQRGTTTFLSVTSLNIPINAVDVTKSIVKVSIKPSGEQVNGVLPMVVLLNSTTIEVTKMIAGNGVFIHWEVIEFYNVKSKQVGNIGMLAATSATAIVSAVNPLKSILLSTFKTSNTANTTNYNQAMVEITSPTQVVVSTAVAFTATVHYQLIEFN